MDAYEQDMTTWLFEPPEPVSLPIVGGEARFPIRRILCVGRNYAAHAREMGGDPTREPPFFFSKPADAIVSDGADVPYPAATGDLHHEVELVCAIGPDGGVLGWAVGVDLTRRDLQAAAKARGGPWDAAKGFDHSAPCGALTLAGDLPEPAGAISLTVNGEVRQHGDLGDMIWRPAEVVSEAAKLWTLAPGDLIFTGTPEGVGALVRGDRVEARCAGLAPLSFTVTL